MRARMAITVPTAMTALAIPAGALASGPTSSQIQKAVQAAERSKQLWATVNVCNPPGRRGELGLRGQMPSLGFTARLYMTFEVYYRPSGKSAFRPLRGTRNTRFVGRSADKVLQAGETYPFKPPAVLAGKITFEWRREGKVLGRTTRMTTAGRHADFADPKGYSAAICKLH